MKNENSKPVYLIELSLAYVKYGGNTGTNDQYFFCYNPKSIYVQFKSQLVYTLADSTSDRFEIVEFLSSDDRNQFADPVFSNKNRTISVCNNNTGKQLINLTLIIKDNNADKDMYFSCDPQVLNSPGTIDP